MRIRDRLAKLIDVKSIVTLTLTGVFAYMCIADVEVPENFKTIYVMIIGFYFGTQAEKNKKVNARSLTIFFLKSAIWLMVASGLRRRIYHQYSLVFPILAQIISSASLKFCRLTISSASIFGLF